MKKRKITNVYRTLSKKAQSLLNYEENYDVEFKTSLADLDNSDIVAFANSTKGGSILIGVMERKSGRGHKKPKIVGCQIDDKSKLQIINRAETCVPPVDIEVIAENTSRIPFYRIEIASGAKKPYCTSGGTYKMRGDGRNKALLPGRLLAMFVEQESEQFLKRFQKATSSLEKSVQDTSFKIVEELNELLMNIREMEINIENSLEGILGAAEDATYLSDEATASSNEISAVVNELDRVLERVEDDTRKINTKTDALLKHFDIEDPNVANIKRMIRATVEKLVLAAKKKIRKEQVLTKLQLYFPGIPTEELKKIYIEHVAELKKKKRKR